MELRRHLPPVLASVALAAGLAVLAHPLLRGPAAPPPPPTGEAAGDPAADTPVGRAREALAAHVRALGYELDQTESAGFIDVFDAPVLGDAFEEQRFVFVARAPGAEPVRHRDVFLVRARIAPNGVPVSVGEVFNLTRTPDGDEAWVTPRPGEVAFCTRFADLYTGVTLLDLNGAATEPGLSLETRLTRALTDLLETGDLRGVQVTRLVLDRPAVDLRLAWDGDALVVSRAERSGWSEVRLDPTALRAGEAPGVPWLSLVPTHRATRSLVNWAVDTARGLSFIGPERIYALEAAFFKLNDLVQTARYRLLGAPAQAELEAGAELAAAEPPSPEPAPEGPDGLPDPQGPWPIERAPEDLKPTLDPPLPDEGRWRPFHFQARPAHAPPIFWTTTLRVDQERPDAITVLVLADARQVGLRMVGGTEHPRSTTGEVGTGMVPEADRPRTLAAFNGGFQAIHGGYGMIVDKTVLLPPVPQVGTVAVYASGRTAFGTWREGERAPPELLSLRQNLPPLLEDGAFNPLGRRTWGFTVKGSDPVFTWRSGLGVTRAGRIVFAVCVRCSADTLADGLAAADAVYAVHLDMNISNIGFEWWRPGERPGSIARAALFRDLWHAESPRYVDPHPRDFFYLVRADPLESATARLSTPPSAEGLPHPAGMWPPPLTAGQVAAGARTLKALRFERTSLSASPVAGAGDWCSLSVHRGVPGDGLPASTSEPPEPAAPGRATLWLDADGHLRLSAPGATPLPPQGAFFQQLPALRVAGKATGVALPGPNRYLLGEDAEGALWLLGGAASMAELDAAAERLGLDLAVAPTPVNGAPTLRCGAKTVIDGSPPLSAHTLHLGRSRTEPAWPATHVRAFSPAP